MIDGLSFISNFYAVINNTNNPIRYKELYHPDILWCPPNFEDKRGVDLVAFVFGLKGYLIEVEVIEIEGVNGIDMAYVTGLVKVHTFKQNRELIESFVLRGSWLVIEHENKLCIRYQVWNRK